MSRNLIPVVALGLALAACGGSSRSGAGSTPAPSTSGAGMVATPAAEPYTWLVPTTGSPSTVAAENRHAGTTAWRLPGPAAEVGGLAHGDVSGYVSAPSLRPGEIERIFVSAPGARYVRIRVFRMGWYGGTGGREVLRSRRLRLRAQRPCGHDFETGLTRCHWHATLSFSIPPALPTGVYIAKLSTPGGSVDTLFVVRSAQPTPLLAQVPTSTYQAYNAWGGDSLYPGGADRVGVTGTTQGVEVSYDRPYDSVTGAGQFFARDVAMVRFLERYGYPVSYTTSEAVDDHPDQLIGHRALLDFGHSEYWSARQAAAFARARDAGTNLLFVSSDTLAWRIRYADRGHLIFGYKEHAAKDPDRAQPSGPFPGGGASLTGSAYLGCITPRLPVKGPPTYRYYEWAPSPRLRPAWLFRHTGINAATRIPGIVGYELNMRAPATPQGVALIGSGRAPCAPAEHGEPRPTRAQDLAETTLYTAPSGALVFSTGTLGWELGLEPVPSASPDAPRAPDPRVVAMTRNLLRRVLSGSRG